MPEELDLSKLVPPPPPSPDKVLEKAAEMGGNILELPLKAGDGIRTGIDGVLSGIRGGVDGLLGGIRDGAGQLVETIKHPPVGGA